MAFLYFIGGIQFTGMNSRWNIDYLMLTDIYSHFGTSIVVFIGDQSHEQNIMEACYPLNTTSMLAAM